MKQELIKEDLNEWIEVKEDVEFWRPEIEGQSIEGQVIEIVDDKWKTKQYRIFNKKLNITYITPSHAQLQSLLNKIGLYDVVKIEYKGEKEINKGNPLNIYKLWVKPVIKKDSF